MGLLRSTRDVKVSAGFSSSTGHWSWNCTHLERFCRQDVNERRMSHVVCDQWCRLANLELWERSVILFPSFPLHSFPSSPPLSPPFPYPLLPSLFWSINQSQVKFNHQLCGQNGRIAMWKWNKINTSTISINLRLLAAWQNANRQYTTSITHIDSSKDC